MNGWVTRRLRSASFRAGLITAFIVAVLIAIPVLLGLGASVSVSTGSQDLDVTDYSKSLEDGVSPEDLWDESALDFADLYVVFDGDANVIYEVGDAPPEVREALGDERFRAVASSPVENFPTIEVGDTQWSVLNDEATAPDGTEYLVAVAYETQFASLTSTSYLLPSAILILFASGMSGMVAAWVVRRSLRRVDAIQTEVQQISSTSLHRRLSVNDIADPIDRLPHTMNDMLERLDVAQQRQNQFIADASHELRSPVAGILAQLEVALQYPDQVNVGELLPKLHADGVRTQGIVNDLLYLNRLEGGAEKKFDNLSVPEAVSLLVAEVERYRSSHSEVEISLDRSLLVLDEAEGLRGLALSESHLGRVVQNLFDNAVRHCDSRVNVTVRVDPPLGAGRHVTFAVSDDGAGITDEDRDRVFSRFVRLDEARSRDKGGSGLGLAITKELVERAGGTIAVVDSPDADYPGATFEVRLPVAPE